MKKIYLLFSSAVLASLPIMAQEKPAATPDDPEVVFTQDFESDQEGLSAQEAWQQWQDEERGRITEITYYSRSGTGQVSSADIYDGSDDWKVAGVRTDSIIILQNGVVPSNNEKDKANGIFNNDRYGLVADGANVDRSQAFAKYGEDGGEYFFRYTSASAKGADGYGAYSDGVTERYRRDLFVRGLDIQDNSSYRLTLYIKARKLAGTAPTFYADVMRGYSNSEKPFSIDLKNGSAKFEYDKKSFNGNWEKVTFMTYYLNDSIADGFVYGDGYYWATDEWTWNVGDKTYNYIKQPDKFFVRLSFASDSTEFEIDNISLTKSWIGGVEHADNMIRVDFGYETNLKDLAKAAFAETGIAAVELPGRYFSVYGYYNDEDLAGWYPVDIASAEYHDDGYMYMWSQDVWDDEDNMWRINPFDIYDSILVSFVNPVENDKICLKYTGKTYPCALDADWVAAGKTVKNFSNEVSKLNPNIKYDKYGKLVTSMKEVPPVVQKVPFENGSFGLTSFDSITVGMSRLIEFDNIGETSDLAFLRVTRSGVKEIWTVSSYGTNDSTATFVRSAADKGKNGDLNGTYLFEFINLKGAGTDYRVPNPTLNYEFGTIDTNPDPNPQPVFASNFAGSPNAGEQCVPEGLIVWDGYTTTFGDGKGYVKGTKSRMYPTAPSEGNGNSKIGIYLSSRGNEMGGHLFYGYGINESDTLTLKLNPGSYSLNFRAANWDGYTPEVPITVYIYPRSATANPQTNPIADEDKINLGTFIPSIAAKSSAVQSSTPADRVWENEPFSFSFTITKQDYYVIEWVSAMGESGNAKTYGGMMMTDFNITPGLGLSYAYVIKLNKAISDAKAKLASADADKYRGADYTNFEGIISQYENWQSTAPSQYDATTALVKAATDNMQLRMDTVDLFYTTYDKVIAKLAEFDDDTLGYTDLAAFIALETLADDNEDYDCSTKTCSEITASITSFEDAIKALDARLELMGKFEAKLDQAEALIAAENAHKEYAEFAVLEDAYATAAAFDQITPTDDEYTAGYLDLCQGINTYLSKVDGVIAFSRQAKELFALADTLGYQFGGKKDSIKAVVAALEQRDVELENVLREAAILQILKIYNEADAEKIAKLQNFNVSALIPNYFLYNEAQVDRDMEKNSSGKWRIKAGENSTVFPGWTINSGGGSWIPTTVKVGEGDGYIEWDIEGHPFAGGLRGTPQARGTLTTTVAGLPQGYYWFGFYSQNQTSGVNYTIKTDSLNQTGKMNDDWNGTKKWNYKEIGQDSIMVAGNFMFQINQTSQSSSEFDIRYFILRLRGLDKNYDYASAINAQEAKLEDLITFADASASEVKVQYYNLAGVEIDSFKQGEILIRKTTLSDGSVVVDKILVK